MSENQRPDATANTNNTKLENADGPTSQSQPTAAAQKDPVLEAQQAAEKFKNDFLYLRAEFDNYKRNAIKERADLMRYGSERLLVEILGVLDNFERALETKITPETLPQYVKGVEMTAGELKGALQRFGVTEVPALGQNFDPLIHEAISSEETAQYEAGQISRVFKKPYKLHDKLIRPGQVVVAKKLAQ